MSGRLICQGIELAHQGLVGSQHTCSDGHSVTLYRVAEVEQRPCSARATLVARDLVERICMAGGFHTWVIGPDRLYCDRHAYQRPGFVTQLDGSTSELPLLPLEAYRGADA